MLDLIFIILFNNLNIQIVNTNYLKLHLTSYDNHLLDFNLTLIQSQNDLLMPTSDKYEQAQETKCYYTGYVNDDFESSLFMNLCRQNTMMGTFIYKLKAYFIEPARLYDDSIEIFIAHSTNQTQFSTAHYLHFNEATDNDANNCSLLDEHENPKKFIRKRQIPEGTYNPSTLDEVYLETLVVIDEKMIDFYTSSQIHYYVLTQLFIASEIFKHPSMSVPLHVIVSDIVYLNKSTSTIDVTWDAEKLLNDFCTWQSQYKQKKRIEYDVAILITKQNLCKSPDNCATLGMARLGRACDQEHNCAIVEDGGVSSTGFTIAHEIGHLIGLPHVIESQCEGIDRSNQVTYIMSSSLDLTRPFYRWAPCTIERMDNFLRSDSALCLLNKPPSSSSKYLNRYMEELDQSIRYVLPGERYSANTQCQQQFGKDTELCPFTPACQTLWCRKKGQDGCTTTSLKWADGTECESKEKHCIKGQCVLKSELHGLPRDGIWSKWSEWSECSRTCGGGIRRSTRTCTNPEPKNGGKLCTGERIKYESCNTQLCGLNTIDFRDLQCRRAAANPLKHSHLETLGFSLGLQWKASHSKIPREKCRLICSPHGSDRTVQFENKVEDGTKCDLDSDDICVNGVCLPAGCDNVIYSKAEYDNCFVCNGDESTCELVEETYDAPTTYGYHDLFTLPMGSTNLYIRRNRDGNVDDGFLSVKTSKESLINGNYVVTRSSIKDIKVPGDGTLEYVFSREQEIIKSHGKIGSELQIQFLGEDTPNGQSQIYIRFYRPREHHNQQSPHFKSKYGFDYNRVPIILNEKKELKGEWISEQIVNTSSQAACSKECQGEMRMKQKCVDLKTNRLIDEIYCVDKQTRERVVPCNTHCRFIPVQFGQRCVPNKGSCGAGYIKADIRCYKKDDNHKNPVLSDPRNCDINQLTNVRKPCDVPCQYMWARKETACSVSCGRGVKHVEYFCASMLNQTQTSNSRCSHEKRPNDETQECFHDCYEWKTTAWSVCSSMCDGGHQNRSAVCVLNNGEKVRDEYCSLNNKPLLTQKCNDFPCPNEWHSSQWSACSSKCGRGVQERRVACVKGNKLVNPSVCNHLSKPMHERECKGAKCVQWTVSQWSTCSKSCGLGVRKRNVHCETSNDSACDPDEKPVDIENCSARENCDEWLTDSWSACSKTCGTGHQKRRVYCSGAENTCDTKSKPHTTQVCNLSDCRKPEWKVGAWSECDHPCGSAWKLRSVTCIDNKGILVNETYCEKSQKPSHYAECHVSNCGTWSIGNWSACSCLNSTRIRDVTCVSFNNTLQILDENACDLMNKPNKSQICSCSRRDQNSHWKIMSTTECSKRCGSGFKRRIIKCLFEDGSPSNRCTSHTRPNSSEVCNQEECAKWEVSDWSECSVSCGKGTQIREVQCKKSNKIIDDRQCLENEKPKSRRECRLSECPQWITGPWSECDLNECEMKRQVDCRFINNSSYESHVLCNTNTKPNDAQKCDCLQAKIHHSPWSPCNATCTNPLGNQTRNIYCRLNDANQTRVNLKRCNLTINIEIKECKVNLCEQYEWRFTHWSSCSASCGFGNKTRHVFCMNSNKKLVDVTYCKHKSKPISTQGCLDTSCGYTWLASNWSKCSNTCSNGIRTRIVKCVQVTQEGKILDKISNECLNETKPVMQEVCSYGECSRGYFWRAEPWSNCSTNCGFGIQKREISCFSKIGLNSSLEKCNRKLMPAKYQMCYEYCHYYSSCSSIKTTLGISHDAHFNLNLFNKTISIYCKAMNTTKPLEYISLTSEIENYAEIYDKKLKNADGCFPRWGPRNNISCKYCTNETMFNYGATYFSKIRIDLNKLLVVTNDFSFATLRYGSPVPYGMAGDCYSKRQDCAQGNFRINLRDTGFKLSNSVNWISNGTSRVLKDDHNRRAKGICGGYCSTCQPDPLIGLQLELV